MKTRYRRLQIAIGCLFAATAAILFGYHVFVVHETKDALSYVERKTPLRLPAELSSVRVYNDPSLIHPYWFFIRLRIPSQMVKDFVARNHLERTNETTLRHQRESIPEVEQRIDGPTARFYKHGRTSEGLPFDVLVNEGGDLILFVMTPD